MAQYRSKGRRRSKLRGMPDLMKLLLSQRNIESAARPDGKWRISFNARRRPLGYPSYAPICADLDPSDEAAVRAALEEAKRLQRDLQLARERERARAVEPEWPLYSIPRLVRLWCEHTAWKALKPRTQASYEWSIKIIEAWSESNGHRPIKDLRPSDISTFLAVYNDRQAQRQALRACLSMMLSIGVEAGWIKDNPAKHIILRRTQAKKPVLVWTPDDVVIYAEKARSIGWDGGSVLYRCMWETAADASDVSQWSAENLLRELPAIRMARGKTGIMVQTPISEALAKNLSELPGTFVRSPEGEPFKPLDDDNKLRWLHRKVSYAVEKEGGRKLGLKQLRHSASTHAVDCGADITEASRLLAHAGPQMANAIYVQKTYQQLLRVQQLRGIVPADTKEA